ncbi:MAG: hypothetical protein LBF50_09275 [Azoarcus sp.]|nr:hypothetical protein [Azoarcus sp.]
MFIGAIVDDGGMGRRSSAGDFLRKFNPVRHPGSFQEYIPSLFRFFPRSHHETSRPSASLFHSAVHAAAGRMFQFQSREKRRAFTP